MLSRRESLGQLNGLFQVAPMRRSSGCSFRLESQFCLYLHYESRCAHEWVLFPFLACGIASLWMFSFIVDLTNVARGTLARLAQTRECACVLGGCQAARKGSFWVWSPGIQDCEYIVLSVDAGRWLTGGNPQSDPRSFIVRKTADEVFKVYV